MFNKIIESLLEYSNIFYVRKFSKEDIEQLTTRIKRSYIRHGGRPDGWEDCAQEILLRMVVGHHKRAKIDYAVIDYLRAKSTNKDKAVSQSVEFMDDLQYDEKLVDETILSLSKHVMNDLLRNGHPTERACVILQFKWGMTNTEISEVLGISFPTIDRHMAVFKRKLKRSIREGL